MAAALVGAAIDERLLDGADARVAEILDAVLPQDTQDIDNLRASMTVDLLMTSTGLGCRDGENLEILPLQKGFLWVFCHWWLVRCSYVLQIPFRR